MAKPLDVKDRKIMQLIGQCPSATILGLLPVDPSDQDGILELVKTLSNGSFNRLAKLQEDYPAAVSYAIALALSKGTTEANFYNALENQLGVHVPLNRRQELSMAFDVACRALGLIMPECEEETHSDRILRPIIFQAGMLHYWVEPLAEAVLNYLERNPCPDLEDEQQVAPFACLLAERVPAAQARLRRTLESTVGPLVCRAILSAFSTRDFDQLPPHLREPMREARKRTGGESIRSPYLRYNPEDGSMEVVLPKQNSKLADFHSCWVLGTNTYNALIERTLAVADLARTKCEILLKGLRNRFRDQVFTVKLAPDEQEPFFIFRATDGRRLQVGLRAVIELSLGDYHVVLPIEHQTNEEEAFGLRGQFKTGKVEVFPGRPDLEILAGENTIVLRPKLGSDLLIHDKAGNKLQALDGTVLFYGDGLEMQAYTPAGSVGGSEAMEFNIECVENPTVIPKKLSREKANTKGAYHFYELSADLIRPFLSGLAAGIHEVQVTAEGHARSFSRRFFYWKGFRRTTKSFGFVCDGVPQNFDAATSVGILQAERGLQICEDHPAADVVIGIKHPQKTFTLAKPGIWLRLMDLERMDSRPLALGKSIDVNANEQLILESGDTLPWTIRCAETVLAELKPGQAKHTLNLGALLSQFGESLALEARNASGQTQELVSFAKANLARQLEVETAAHSPLYHQLQGSFGAHQNLVVEEASVDSSYRASFRIGRSQIQQLEVRISNFADSDSEVALQRIQVTEGAFTIEGSGLELAKITIKAENCDWLLRFEADPTTLPPGVYFIEFRTRKPDQSRWQPLKVADKHGQSESRLMVSARPACADDQDGWGRTLLLALAQPAPNQECEAERAAATIPKENIKQALERLQTALLFKYASPVWSSVQWLETALIRVCQDNYSSTEEDVARAFAEVAVASLSAKAHASLSIHSTLVFGCQPLLLSAAASFFPEFNQGSLIDQSFGEMHKLAAAPTLKDYAAARFQSGCAHAKFLSCFTNFQAVFSNRANEFKGFDYQRYFESLAKASQELDTKQAEVNADTLLSAEHLLVAVKPLNRRLRPLASSSHRDQAATASNAKGTGLQGSLERMAAEIRIMHGVADRVAPVVKERAGIPNYLSLTADRSSGIVVNEEEQTAFGLTIPAETHFALKVSDLLITLTGLGRLRAHRLLDGESFLRHISDLLGPEGDSLGRRTQRLCLLLSLAPELFAFYMLFWEATLKPRAKT